MFERFHEPREAYNFKLGAALKMENTALEILEDAIGAAQDEEIKADLRHHQKETREHIANLHRVFEAFEWEIDESPCPTIEALQKEGKSTAKKTDDSFVDSVILGGAMEVEHHEIAVYEFLILNARAMGRDDVVQLLQKNLENEQQTLQKVTSAAEAVAKVSPKQPA